MAQNLDDIAAKETLQEYEALGAEVTDTAKRNLFQALENVKKASRIAIGGLLVFISKKVVVAEKTIEEANRNYIKEKQKEEKVVTIERGPAVDAPAIAAPISPVPVKSKTTEPKIAKSRGKHFAKTDTKHYDEAFLFDDEKTASKIGAMVAIAEKDVKIKGNQIVCKKEDAAVIYAMAKYSDAACCSLTDMKTLCAYVKEIKREKDLNHVKEGLEVTIDPAHFEDLEGRSPQDTVEMLHRLGIESAELRDGKIYAESEEVESLKMAKADNSITVTAMANAVHRIEELNMGNIIKQIGGHFKTESKEQDSPEQSAEIDEKTQSVYSQAFAILAEDKDKSGFTGDFEEPDDFERDR